MSYTDAERVVEQMLVNEGFIVACLEEGTDARTADFRAADGKSSYLIEVKSKVDGEGFHEELRTGDVVMRDEPRGRRNVMSRIVRDAAEQLGSTPADGSEFRIIWFVAEGRDVDLQAEQFRSTLYGTADLLVAGREAAVRCYYFTYSEFFRLREVDCALITKRGGSLLCVNNLGVRARRLRETKLYKDFESAGALCDPELEESRGKAFVADCPGKRCDEKAIEAYLSSKYDVKILHVLKLRKYSAAVLLDSENRKESH
jgi:hypothetical protein